MMKKTTIKKVPGVRITNAYGMSYFGNEFVVLILDDGSKIKVSPKQVMQIMSDHEITISKRETDKRQRYWEFVGFDNYEVVR